MPPKSKSVFRQPGVQHFQLVHRSQRDPLVNDPSASKHVLKAFERENLVKKGKSRADLESILGDELQDTRENVGEASLYGIYYDDTDYDYMQHLRPVGDSAEEGVDSVLLEAPSSSKPKGKRKAVDLELRLPAESLPSTNMRTQLEAQDSLLGVPSALLGLNPDMDPHLRQTLEALEDDEFVMDDADDREEEDWFGELLGSGELEEGKALEFEFEEWGVEDGEVKAGPHIHEHEDGEEEEEVDDVDDIRARLAAFKLAQTRRTPSPTGSGAASDNEDEDAEFCSEAADTLPPLAVIGGKRRHKGTRSDASGFSMSSSSVYRAAGQRLMDDRFDLVEQAYEEGSDEEHDSDDGSSTDSAPDLLSRADFESIVDGFLEKYEQIGHTVRPTSEKLETIRRALEPSFHALDGKEDDDILMPVDVDEEKERWDCETILSTYSNMENHPRVISARLDGRGMRKILLDQKTGLPTVEQERRRKKHEHDGAGERPRKVQKMTVARPKEESKDERKARKTEVKQERQARRSEKKATKTAFSTERKAQLKSPTAVTTNAIKL